MYHSVTFGSYNTYARWHLVPDSRPVINPPDPITSYIDVPGSSGGLDLTEALTGYTTYTNRSGSLLFHVLNDNNKWINVYQDLVNKLHGRKMKMILEDDPDWYYYGRYTVNWVSNNDGTWSDVEIGYTLDPYKYYKTPFTLTDSVSGGSSNAYTNASDIFGSNLTQPVIPKLTISTNTTPGAWIAIKNPELGLSYAKTKTDTYATTVSDVPLFSCPLSNMSGSNNLVIKAGADGSSGSFSFTMTVTRAII